MNGLHRKYKCAYNNPGFVTTVQPDKPDWFMHHVGTRSFPNDPIQVIRKCRTEDLKLTVELCDQRSNFL
jgi:hypothetical protein